MSWLWNAFFGSDTSEQDEVVDMAAAELTNGEEDWKACHAAIESCEAALRQLNCSSRTLLEYAEEQQMSIFDFTVDGVLSDVDGAALQAMQQHLLQEVNAAVAVLLQGKEELQKRHYRLLIRQCTLEKQREVIRDCIEEQLRHPSSTQKGRVQYPSTTTVEFLTYASPALE